MKVKNALAYYTMARLTRVKSFSVRPPVSSTFWSRFFFDERKCTF